jgi:hypothetical protein
MPLAPQVTRSSDLEPHQLSPQEEDTIAAIVEASSFPLSIVVVGVGDGEDGWRRMREFDDLVPARRFDNFQFLPFSSTMADAYTRIRASGITDPDRIRQVRRAAPARECEWWWWWWWGGGGGRGVAQQPATRSSCVPVGGGRGVEASHH